MGRLGRPDELNGLAVFLASEASSFVTGAEILADVSFSLFFFFFGLKGDMLLRDAFVGWRGGSG